jgi:hypothetical protein
MRKLTMAACAIGLAFALGTGMASRAQASSVIVVGPGHSIQAAINAARPGDTVFVRPGVYHQSVQIRTNGITLRGSGAFHGGTVLVPPKHIPRTMCNAGFGPTGVCVLARRLNPKTGAVFVPVRNDTVTGLLVTGFPGNGVFGYGTVGLSVTRVVAVNDGGYGISRFVSSKTIVVLSAKPLTHGSNPEFDTISFNFAFRNHPADLIWDHSGFDVRFRHNDCGTSIPGGLCH